MPDALKESLDFVLHYCEKNDWDKNTVLDFSWDGAPIGDLQNDPALCDQLIAEIMKRGYNTHRTIGQDFFVVFEGFEMWAARQPPIEIDASNPNVKIINYRSVENANK